MKRLELRWWRLVRYLAYLGGAVLLGAGLLSVALARAAGNEAATPSWAAPSVMALKQVSPVASAQHEPNFLSNLDCTLAAIVWLLALLGLGARRLVNRTKIYQNQRLSTTIDK